MPREQDVFAAGAGPGGNANAGAAQGGTGGRSGTSSSGSSSGGSSSGGPNSGGSSSGGPNSGGSSSGGLNSGGSSNAGAGGANSTAGRNTGGASLGGKAGAGASSGGAPTQAGAGSHSGGRSSLTLEDGLVAHFPFDETSGAVVRNLKDAANNGAYFGGCTHPAGRIGRAVGLRNLEGSPDWVELPDGLLRELSATTLSLWMRVLSTARPESRVFHFSRGASEEIYFAPHGADSLDGGHLGGAHAGSTFVDLWSPGALTDKAWHHFTLTWDAASIALYLDGEAVGKADNPSALPSDLGATSPNWIGRTLDDAVIPIYAEVDDLRIYDRVLPASQVAELYRAD